MASSSSSSFSSSSRRTSSFENKYPYHSEFKVTEFVPELNGNNYDVWKKLMLDFIKRRGLAGFIDGTVVAENNEEEDEDYRSWERSDVLLRGWILKTLTQDILGRVLHRKTAKDVWTELERIFDPVQNLKLDEETEKLKRYQPLHKYAIKGDWKSAIKFIEEEPGAASIPITIWSETALHVAIRMKRRNYFVKKVVEKMASEDLARAEFVGHTALHLAAGVGNFKAAKLLMEKNPELAYVRDHAGEIPLHCAAAHGKRKMVLELLKGSREPFEDKSGAKLLCYLASSGLYDIALNLLQSYPEMACMEEFSPSMVIVEKSSSFRSGTSLNFWQNLIYQYVPMKLENNANHHRRGDIENPVGCFISYLASVKQKLCAMFWEVADKIVPQMKHVREKKLEHHQALQLVKFICKEVAKSSFEKALRIFTLAIQKATFVGIHEIVEEILEACPSVIGFRNPKQQYIFLYAIECRCENVFNLLYQLEESGWLTLVTMDELGNNALHLVGSLAPQQQLRLRVSAAGAALQMQRELQWFKAVEKLVLPKDKEKRNDNGMTPKEIFIKTHQELVKEGEQWMRDTANSCTIVAALIATVVFAAAITVPGGNNNNGLPNFSKEKPFIIFGISDAIALFTSISSILTFLSILTARYGEEDFLYALPTRLILGLVTLFISILSTMIAFGATLYIVFGNIKAWILFPIVAWSCVPVTLFVALQFPLLVYMIKSTYGRGIFYKQSDRLLY